MVRTRALAFLGVLGAVGAISQPTPARAADPDEVPAPAPPPGSTQCTPACREGFTCVQGQCVSACNPACAAGESCVQGRCVSANCNPPCGAGETCSSGGVCIVEQGYTPPTGYPPQPTYPPQTAYGYAPYAAPAPQPPPPPPEPGWAVGAGITGLVLAGGVAIFAGLSTYHAETLEGTEIVGNNGTSLGFGIVPVVLVAAGVPIVAAGGGSARGHPDVRGIRALRVLSWITYGGTLLSSLIMISVSVAAQDGMGKAFPGWITATGILGGVSLLFASVDAFVSAAQSGSVRETYRRTEEAEEAAQPAGEAPATEAPAQESRLELAPVGGVGPGPDGSTVGWVGLAGAF